VLLHLSKDQTFQTGPDLATSNSAYIFCCCHASPSVKKTKKTLLLPCHGKVMDSKWCVIVIYTIAKKLAKQELAKRELAKQELAKQELAKRELAKR
jgi:hypothetical protein